MKVKQQNLKVSSSGFTLIELLMVILLVSLLGAMALPQFLDFRKEAKAAVLRGNLATIRVGMKNQLLQVKLRCRNLGTSQGSNSNGIPNSFYLQAQSNNITLFSGDASSQICTTSEIPNEEERKFWNISPSNSAIDFATKLNGTLTSGSANNRSPLPMNPFAYDFYEARNTGFALTSARVLITSAAVAAAGGACSYVSGINAAGFFPSWMYLTDTGEIFACTNTPGVNECNF